MWWQDLLFGIWNGWTGWLVLIIHLFGGLKTDPVYDLARNRGWYQCGFLIGAGTAGIGGISGGSIGARSRVTIGRR